MDVATEWRCVLVNHSVVMKVTVCFGSVRVLVPCGAGDLLVRDLVREATHRYKKATGQVSTNTLILAVGSLRGFSTLFIR